MRRVAGMWTRLLDTPLALAGWLGHVASRVVGGSQRATGAVIVGLLVLTAIPIFLVGSTPRPTNLTFEDMRLERIPAMTSWVRLEGELRVAKGAFGTLELHDTHDDRLYVIVITGAQLPPGHTMVTGRVSPRRAETGNVGSIDADIPAIPPVDEPIWLYLTPAVLAIVLAFGLRFGYPVVRRDPANAPRADPLTPEASLPGEWSGRIGGVLVERDRPVTCSISVAALADLPDLAEITIAATDGTRTVRIRRAAPLKRVRLSRIGGARPGLDIHAATADVLLSFRDRTDRERFLASLR